MPAFTSPHDPIIFNNQVWEIVRKVPAGRVATYGQVARLLHARGNGPESLHRFRSPLGRRSHGRLPAGCALAAGHQLQG